MRKHGLRGKLSRRYWTRLTQGLSRKRIQLSFEPDRQTCSWLTDQRRPVIIKH